MKSMLSPNFETLLLLAAARQDNAWQDEIITGLDALGIEGVGFFKRHFPVVWQYYATFLKHKKDSPGAQLLNDTDEILISMYTDIFWRHPAWFDGMEGVLEEELCAAVRQSLIDEDADIIDTVEALGLSDQSKWQVLVLIQRPRQQLGTVAAAVRENLPAFEKAQARVANELAVLLAAFDDELSDSNKTRLLQVTHKASPNGEILPTLALPVAVLVVNQVTFHGLLSSKVAGDGAEPGREELQMGAKALSEKSKVEILLALKDTSLYNLEIADCVGLTPATVSHHMGVLLAAGFVDLEKRNGKVYYQLAQGGIQRFLQGIGRLLL